MLSLDTHETATKEAEHASAFEPPGGFLVWLIVFVELITFGAGFVVFAVQSRADSAVFQSGRLLLSQPIALANTAILLTGGWCMANCMTTLRQRNAVLAQRWIGWAIVSGGTFLVLKSWEYAGKLAHGIGFGNDTFFTLYWLLTGFHFIHVLFAIVLLGYMRSGLLTQKYSPDEHSDVESAGVFWHMCDLIWLLLYPIIYLIR